MHLIEKTKHRVHTAEAGQLAFTTATVFGQLKSSSEEHACYQS